MSPEEGYHVTFEDAAAAVVDEQLLTADALVWAEIVGYRDALTYIQQLVTSSSFRYDVTLLNALHFMMLRHDRSKSPGQFCPSESSGRSSAPAWECA